MAVSTKSNKRMCLNHSSINLTKTKPVDGNFGEKDNSLNKSLVVV